MKTVKLIKKEEIHIYRDENGKILDNLTPQEKLFLLIYKPELCENRVVKNEIAKWKYTTQKETDERYYKFIKENNLNEDFFVNYYTEVQEY